MTSEDPKPKPPRAPTYVGIIVFKLVKGLLFLGLAVTVYTLSDNDLNQDFHRLLERLRPVWQVLQVQPDNKFFTHIAEAVADLTEAKALVAAALTLVYSLFSMVEGVGLMFHVTWAGWMAIGESAFFIPIELYELSRPAKFSWWLLGLLIVNVIILWYLFRNRDRLFHRPKPSPG